MNARLIIAILTSLLDDVIIVAIIIWGLPELGVHVPLVAIILVLVVLTTYSVLTFRFGSRVLRAKPLAGLTSMLEMKGLAIGRLNPKGTVKLQGEIWAARAESGEIDSGERIEVVGQEGLKLVVRAVPKKAGPQTDK